MSRVASVTLRLAWPADERELARLAALDSRPVPTHPVLVAERHGALIAARSLDDGAVVADPFQPTADVVELLHAHAAPHRDESRRPRRTFSALRLATR